MCARHKQLMQQATLCCGGLGFHQQNCTEQPGWPRWCQGTVIPGYCGSCTELQYRICCLQSTNPLARCVEYLQEDLETMNTELKFWSAERQLYQVFPNLQACCLLSCSCSATIRLLASLQTCSMSVSCQHEWAGCKAYSHCSEHHRQWWSWQ